MTPQLAAFEFQRFFYAATPYALRSFGSCGLWAWGFDRSLWTLDPPSRKAPAWQTSRQGRQEIHDIRSTLSR